MEHYTSNTYKMKIRITNLNNKSRKGTYVYIKAPGSRSAYYKLQEGTPIDAYTQYYKERYTKKKPIKRGVKKYTKAFTQAYTGHKPKQQTYGYQSAQKYLRKIKKKYPTLQKAIKKGITTTTINEARTANNTTIKNAKIQLFKKLVLDQQLLQLIIKDENLRKIKSRFEYTIEIKDNKHQTIATAQKYNATIEEVIEELKHFKNGETTDPTKNYGTTHEKLKYYNWKNIQETQQGKIQQIKLKIKFVKGK